MDDITKQTLEEFADVWRSILSNVLQCSDHQVEEWMSEYGTELLEDPSIALHEESWYWLCATIVYVFAADKNIDCRESENRVFFILESVYREPQGDIDWSSIRQACKEAVR